MATEEPPPEPAAATMSGRIGEVKKQFVDRDDTKEHAREISKKMHQGGEELKSDGKAGA